MEESILFRSMIKSLSTNEFNQFSDKIFEKFNVRELLTESLFHLLAYQGRNALNTKYTNNINNILINIIHSRQDQDEDKEEEEVTDSNKISITNLSYDLVSNVGSYLDFYDSMKYRLINRHIYISCKQCPSSITTMPTHNAGWFKKYTSNNFGCQKNILYLAIKTNTFD